jgi:hypothetical protein
VIKSRKVRQACIQTFGPRPHERLRHIWAYNVKMELKEINLEDVWTVIHLAQSRDGSCEHGNELSGLIKGRTFSD